MQGDAEDVLDGTAPRKLTNISFYSKTLKEALKYFINPEYLDNYETEKKVWNSYADKHQYLLDHQMLYGNKKDSLHEDFRPYKHALKNEQYFHQKQMSFILPELKVEFMKRFPKLIKVHKWWDALRRIKKKSYGWESYRLDIVNALGLKGYKDCISLYSKCIDFHHHIFRASEKYGRIYMPFHNLPKEFRSCIKYTIRNQSFKIVEYFDLTCCFVQLSALLAQAKLQKETQKDSSEYQKKLTEYKQVKELAENDIYTDILNTVKPEYPGLSRTDIKKHIMAWLFSTNTQRKHSNNQIIQAISEYFKTKFPNYNRFITKYKTVKSEHKLKTKDRAKKISSLSIDCFQFETQLFFNQIIPSLKTHLNSVYPGLPIISLHDGIYILEPINNLPVCPDFTQIIQDVQVLEEDFFSDFVTLNNNSDRDLDSFSLPDDDVINSNIKPLSDTRISVGLRILHKI
jgi:hypothetical protein